MRIAMIGPFGLHPNKTMGSRALGFARPLQQRGHEVALLMPPWQTPQEAGRRWKIDGVQIVYTELGSTVLGTARQLLRDTVAWRPDVVHAFKPKAYSGMVMWWLWQTRQRQLRLVLDMDDWEGKGGWNDLAPYSPAQKRFFQWQEQWGMGHTHALTLASRALESIVWSAGLGHAAYYLPNGSGLSEAGLALDTAAVAARRAALGLNERPVVLLYSRLFEFDPARLVRILAGVRTAVPDVAFLFIGAGLFADDSTRLRDLLAAQDLLSAVHDLGWVEEEALPMLLRTADVALYLMDDTLINRCKCPVKLADLIGAGVPVVAEMVGQVSEYVVSGVNGRLRPVGDEAGLAADIVHYLQRSADRTAAGLAGQAHYRTYFTWEGQCARLERAYGLDSGLAGMP